ncbi:aldose 1-epimerase family protein [Pseudoroseomonas cervicalis]|uniref:Aldose 1-epimerase n=1 Tax=Pseudoroseomonas cervicalis ATCC 49957 TaxID=525371 RepID=D5RKE1_9PROT|nr:aldose 1-epimerase family protein [Pseudoroseomonas cervicalis]EFH12220.1 aldose 1-epimerase [Pseudoroseomonas cervicalis ATCC 49957]
MNPDRHRIARDGLSATIQARGGELVSLRDAAGREWLWQAGPEWRRHAPWLFPIVGKLAGDTLRHEGREYRMGQHGFARDRRFTWLSQDADRCRLRLSDDAESRALYPFAFILELDFSLAGGWLVAKATVANPGRVTLPFAFGAHPAFAWPLPGAGAKESHRLVFAEAEPGPARRLEAGLLAGEEALPMRGDTLPLSPALFEKDALVLPGLLSQELRYVSEAKPEIEMRWQGYPDLGLWSKPEGAGFLCIEPWCGFASPAGWDGEFAEKPGIALLQPGESRDFTWSVRPKG